jgi:hypothetical protein
VNPRRTGADVFDLDDELSKIARTVAVAVLTNRDDPEGWLKVDWHAD